MKTLEKLTEHEKRLKENPKVERGRGIKKKKPLKSIWRITPWKLSSYKHLLITFRQKINEFYNACSRFLYNSVRFLLYFFCCSLINVEKKTRLITKCGGINTLYETNKLFLGGGIEMGKLADIRFISDLLYIFW